jgi:cell division transport system permease protein
MAMKIKTGARHIREGLKNLTRNAWMSFASVSAVAITLLILGISLVIALNVQQMSTYVASQVEIDVFLKLNVSDAQGKQVANQIQSMNGVKSVQLITKEEGFKRLQSQIDKQYKDVVGELSNQNPLPVQIVVKAADPKQTLAIAKEIRSLPTVYQVHDGKDYVDKLMTFLDIVRNVGLVFIAALIITAMFLISNTIKITIFSRRREIEIMKLVGATDWFIRWPFLLEGMIIGFLGAIVPYLAIAIGYRALFEHFGGTFQVLTFSLVDPALLATKLALILFGIGIVIGTWGGVMSVRKFLKV